MTNKNRYTLDDGKQHFYCELIVRGYSPVTIDQYMRTIKEFQKFIHDEFKLDFVDEIKTYHIVKFRTHLDRVKNTKGPLIDKYFSCLKSFFVILEPRNIINKNPMTNLDHKRQSKKNDKYALSFDEINFIVKSKSTNSDSNSHKGKIIFHLILNGVFKREDVINIKVRDIDLDSSSLMLKDRRLVLSDLAIQEIKNYIYVFRKNSNDYLISSSRNTRVGISKYNFLFRSYVDDFNQSMYQSINDSSLNNQVKQTVMENQKLTPTLLKRSMLLWMYQMKIDEAAILKTTGLKDYACIRRLL